MLIPILEMVPKKTRKKYENTVGQTHKAPTLVLTIKKIELETQKI